MADRSEAQQFFYRELLRIPPDVDKPDHYVLLGLEHFERDHGAIVRAAVDRIQLLSACDADPTPGYREFKDQTIASVQQAQLTLCHWDRRREYDLKLARSLGLTIPEAPAEADEEEAVQIGPGTLFAERYRIMGKAREGALGTVFEAMDSNLRTKVWISVLEPGRVASRHELRRVENACRTAATLDHPGILRVDEVGKADGLLYLRTRQVDAETIASAPAGRVHPDEVRRRLIAIASALAYAHERGTAHGDLGPHNVLLDAGGRVLLADFCVSRALASMPSIYRAPEEDPAQPPQPAGDIFALGAMGYQMLRGIPAFTAQRTWAAPLPDGVPADLAQVVTDSLQSEPARRPASAAGVRELLAAKTEAKPRRGLLVLAVAVVMLLAGSVVLLLNRSGDEEPADFEAKFWRLIAGEEYDTAIAMTREQRKAEPENTELIPLLAHSLAEAARAREAVGAHWEAQAQAEEAMTLDPKPEFTTLYERVRDAAIFRLKTVRVRVPEYTGEAVVRVRLGAVPVRSVTVRSVTAGAVTAGAVTAGEVNAEIEGDVAAASLDLEDGRHEVSVHIVDVAGNEVDLAAHFVLDRVPPVVRITEPTGESLLRGDRCTVRVEVQDKNPPDEIEISGRAAILQGGVASLPLKLSDGKHTVTATVRDRAGHEASAQISIEVNTKAPSFTLASDEVATRGPTASIRGTLQTSSAELEVDGKVVRPAEDGSFVAEVPASSDRTVLVEARSPAGIVTGREVTVVVDGKRPEVSWEWPRRDREGRLLYGTSEMDAGGLAIPIRVRDRTGVRFSGDGEVANGVWRLPAREGAWKAVLVATDAAGNATRVRIDLEGVRATPALEVKSSARSPTRAADAVLRIDADAPVTLQGKSVAPGRIRFPLPEGKVELVVVAADSYGNETRWTRQLVVDRTPPRIRLEGKLERGVGPQELVFLSSEPLESLKVRGKVFVSNGNRTRAVVELRDGRQRLHVNAVDHAGNSSRTPFDITARNKVLALDGFSAVRYPIRDDLEEFTLECWVRGFAPVGDSAVASFTEGGSFGLFWHRRGSQFPQALVGRKKAEDGTYAELKARTEWKWTRWTHLALSWDGSYARFFVNGKLQAAQLISEGRKGTGKLFFVGAEPNGRNGPQSIFRGAIDELRLSEVARYKRSFAPKRYVVRDDKTRLLLHFDTDLDDASARKHAATVFGSPQIVAEAR